MPKPFWPCLCRMAEAAVVVGSLTIITAPVYAETRTYTYNARGELTGSSVSGGPANGVQTTVAYDAAGNRTSYQTKGSSAPIRFPIPITMPINGISIITIPQ